MNRHVCITFAGPIGSGKTPIAYYLSWNLRLPILNNDSMRVETQEDEGELITDVYISKKDKRLKDIIDRKIDFILLLVSFAYHSFIIFKNGVKSLSFGLSLSTLLLIARNLTCFCGNKISV